MIPLTSDQPRVQRTRAVLIHNPVSRAAVSSDLLNAAIASGHESGWSVDLRRTEAPRHATSLARDAAANGAEVIIVSGGDGTINEAINGIACTDTALAVLPGGTANVWAKEIGVHKDPLVAMRQMLTGDRRRIDLGRAGDRYFLLMAGIGLDAAIVARMTPAFKRRFGAWSYVAAGVPAALRTKPWRVRLTIDGTVRDTTLYWLVIGNTRSYGGFRDITHRAVADDGKLDVALMHRGGVRHLLVDGVRLLRGTHDRSPNIRYRQVQSIAIEGASIPVQVDGEVHAQTPMRFEAAPGVLNVIVPAGIRSPLFGDRAAPVETTL